MGFGSTVIILSQILNGPILHLHWSTTLVSCLAPCCYQLLLDVWCVARQGRRGKRPLSLHTLKWLCSICCCFACRFSQSVQFQPVTAVCCGHSATHSDACHKPFSASAHLPLVAWLYHACVLVQSSCLASFNSRQCDSQDLTAFGHFGSERITKLSAAMFRTVPVFVVWIQLHSLSAFVCICVCGRYFGWHALDNIVRHRKTMQRVCCKLHHSVQICSLTQYKIALGSKHFHASVLILWFTCQIETANIQVAPSSVGPSMWWASSSSAIFCSCTNQLEMICAESLASSKWSMTLAWLEHPAAADTALLWLLMQLLWVGKAKTARCAAPEDRRVKPVFTFRYNMQFC